VKRKQEAMLAQRRGGVFGASQYPVDHARTTAWTSDHDDCAPKRGRRLVPSAFARKLVAKVRDCPLALGTQARQAIGAARKRRCKRRRIRAGLRCAANVASHDVTDTRRTVGAPRCR
jgi:hypothetical protein